MPLPLLLEFGWNKRSMLFLMGGFNSYMDKILLAADNLSSFLPLLVFLDAPCFLAWWVGVRLLGDRLAGWFKIFSIEEVIGGFVI